VTKGSPLTVAGAAAESGAPTLHRVPFQSPKGEPSHPHSPSPPVQSIRYVITYLRFMATCRPCCLIAALAGRGLQIAMSHCRSPRATLPRLRPTGCTDRCDGDARTSLPPCGEGLGMGGVPVRTRGSSAERPPSGPPLRSGPSRIKSGTGSSPQGGRNIPSLTAQCVHPVALAAGRAEPERSGGPGWEEGGRAPTSRNAN